jgi:O-antigen ligase
VQEIWAFIRRQPLSFWFLCIYLFFEYVRPQSIYEKMAIFPWASFSIAACFASFLVEGNWFRVKSPANVGMAIYSAVVLASSAFGYSPSHSFHQMPLYFSWAVIYILIANISSFEKRFFVFFLSFLLYNLKMSLFAVRSWASIGFHFRDWGVIGAPGWFQNSGEFGIEMTMFLPLSIFFYIALRHRWGPVKRAVFLFLPASALIGMVASSSRGALLGCAAVLLWFLLQSRYKLRALIITGGLAAAMLFITPAEQKARFQAAGQDSSSIRRLIYWKDGIKITNSHPILGIGYDNWLDFYHRYYNPFGQVPHNIFIQASSELGYAGLLAFLGLIGCTFVINRRTRVIARRLPQGDPFLFNIAHGLDGALVGFLVSGFFVTVLYYPFFWINLGMTVALNQSARRELRTAMAQTKQPVALV